MEKDRLSSLAPTVICTHMYHPCICKHKYTHTCTLHTHTHGKEKYKLLVSQAQWLTCFLPKVLWRPLLGNTDSRSPLTVLHTLDGGNKDRAGRERPEGRKGKTGNGEQVNPGKSQSRDTGQGPNKDKSKPRSEEARVSPPCPLHPGSLSSEPFCTTQSDKPS